MTAEDAFVWELAALLIADIRTSGARTPEEKEKAFHTSLKSLLGDAPVPDRIAMLAPTGYERWQKIIIEPSRSIRP